MRSFGSSDATDRLCELLSLAENGEQVLITKHGRPIAPAAWGSFENAERLRERSFRNRTPQQRLDWLVEALKLAYASGALEPRRPDDPP